MPARSHRTTTSLSPRLRSSQPTRSVTRSRPRHVSETPERPHAHWTFLSNHAHVLILLARDPSMILRDVAALVGITERAVQRIIADLESGGFIQRQKVGRRNHYRIRTDQHLRHAIEAHRTIGDLIDLIQEVR